jgi:hypothetical protein
MGEFLLRADRRGDVTVGVSNPGPRSYRWLQSQADVLDDGRTSRRLSWRYANSLFFSATYCVEEYHQSPGSAILSSVRICMTL